MSIDVLRTLKEFSWKGVSFPTLNFKTVIRHDLAQHKFPDRDGADIEPTGQAPLQISAHIVFKNNISGGPNESWGQSRAPLYPYQFRKFIDACQDRAVGPLIHPEFGEMFCVLESVDVAWDANSRDGVDVTASWLQTIVSETELEVFSPSPAVGFTQTGADLDEQLKASVQFGPETPEFKPDFADSMRQITAFTDSISLMERRAFGKIDQIIYRVDKLSDSVDRIMSPHEWPIRQSIERIKDSALRLKDTVNNKAVSGLEIHEVAADSTLAAVAAIKQVALDDLMDLNPNLVRLPFLRRGTKVRIPRKKKKTYGRQ